MVAIKYTAVCRSQSGSLNGAMVELKLEALFCVPFDQLVNPRNLACCGRESECRFSC